MKRGGVSYEKWIKLQISEHRGRRKRAILQERRRMTKSKNCRVSTL